MLSFFRQRGLSNVLYGAIIIGTILTFVINFRPNAASKTASLKETCVARVRGRCIDPKDFASAYRILMPRRSAEQSRRLNLKRVALDGLVERELLGDEAKRLGISVKDEEVTEQLFSGFIRVSVPAADPTLAQSILREMYQGYAQAGLVSQEVAMAHFNDRDTAIPVDFRDPKTKMFDMKAYERTVRNLSNRSTTEFREEQARELLAAKMRDVVREPVRVSESEAWQGYKRRYGTATVKWILVKEAWAARWAAGEKTTDLSAWTKEHQQEFDKTLQEREKDDAPKAGHIRHILVKLPYGAADDEKAAALAKLSWAAMRIRAGEPFAEVARVVSDDTGSAAQGGDVGDKTDGFVGPFKSAANALKAGETTAGAVETQFGYHLITKDDPAKAAEIAAQLKHSLPRQMVTKAEATEVAQRVAKRIAEGMRTGKTADQALADAAAPYPRGGRLELLRVLPAPATTDDDAGSPGDAAGGSRAVGDGGPPGAKALAGVARDRPETRFEPGTDPDRPQVQTSSAFSVGGDPFPGLSPDGTASVVRFAFANKEGDVLTEPVRTPEGFVVVQLAERKAVTREDFDKNREAFEQELVRAKRDEALALYVKRLREHAKDTVKVDDSFVQEARTDGGAPVSSASDEDEESL
jgi:peptidyl-prolyl cis-trans isomerase D